MNKLELLGISSVANVIGAVKTAKYYEMSPNDIVLTIATDSMEPYQSRLKELRDTPGEYTLYQAQADFENRLLGQAIDHMMELSNWDKKRIHNLKYITWVEQLGKEVEELDQQLYDENYWRKRYGSWREWDKQIRRFNEKTGLLKKYIV